MFQLRYANGEEWLRASATERLNVVSRQWAPFRVVVKKMKNAGLHGLDGSGIEKRCLLGIQKT